MFWRFGTGKKLPGRRKPPRSKPANAAWATCALVACAASAFAPGEAWARPKGKYLPNMVKLRVSGSVGVVDYNMFSPASNTRVAFTSLPHAGRRADVEKWFLRDRRPWPLFGMHAELENFPVRLFGREIHNTTASASLSVRLTGAKQKKWQSPELVLSAGAALQWFPEVRFTPGTKRDFDLKQPVTLGPRVALKYRRVLGNNSRWHLDAGAWGIVPLRIARGVGSSKVTPMESMSVGGYAYVDYSLTQNIDLGFGALGQYHWLLYYPASNPKGQSITWQNYAPVVSIQFWLGLSPLDNDWKY